jgi:hypothetical protein
MTFELGDEIGKIGYNEGDLTQKSFPIQAKPASANEWDKRKTQLRAT